MRFRFVHAADIHLDSPLRGLGHTPAFAEKLTFRAFERVISLCLREQVSFLLLAGDLYDKKDRSIRARVFLREQLLRLHQAGIRTFVVHGNHDPLDGDPGRLAMPSSVKIFGNQWESVAVSDSDGTTLCHVQGISYQTEKVTQNLSRHFVRKGPEFHIGLLHANVGDTPGHANYAPCTPEDLSRAGIDYWALGHVHTRKEYPLSTGGLAVYPGNPQGRHINETGPRGCLLVDVDGNKVAARFCPTQVVAWENTTLDFSKFESLDALLDGVTAEASRLLSGLDEDTEGLCLRLTLSGRGRLSGQLSTDEKWAEFEEALSSALQSLPKWVQLESVRNETLPEIDFEQVLAGGGLAGTVGEISQATPSEELFDSLVKEDSALTRLVTLTKREGSLEASKALLERATLRAVELLVEGSST